MNTVPPTKTAGPSEMATGYMTGDARVVGEKVTGAPLVEADVVTLPTQVRRPWRATLRSLFQMALALATLIPFVVAGIYQDGDATPAVVAQVVVVAGIVTRVMALPQVEKFLQDWAPFLAAAPSAIPSKRRK